MSRGDAADLLPDLISPMSLGVGHLALLEDYVDSVVAEAASAQGIWTTRRTQVWPAAARRTK